MKPRQLDARLHPKLSIEVRERLIKQKCERLAHDRASERNTLALAARKLRGLSIEQRLKPERCGNRAHALLDNRNRLLPDAQAETEVVAHRHVRYSA
jgi:hypothetical protein